MSFPSTLRAPHLPQLADVGSGRGAVEGAAFLSLYTEYETPESFAATAIEFPFTCSGTDFAPRFMATIPVRTISSTP